ncbi:MAG: Asp23/Gls24 family envelope stress response protein [Clostridia bacterium]|nr:Asp23/Gls24 family envelope stress response protein [Clostridia bacterium]
MSVKTSNAYGNITISNEAIAIVTGYIARDCYGVVDLVNQKLTDSFSGLFTKKQKTLSKGIKILTVNNRIYVDLYVVLKYGVSIGAVADSLKKSVKYGLEQFTGMIIDSVNVNVVGVRV